MKKLIFRKFAKDTLVFFLIMCLTIGLIVWTLQAVNYFDFVTQDLEVALHWFSLSADQGDEEAAVERDKLLKLLK